MQEEIWKDVKGYEGLYEISNLGRCYSFISSKILSKCRNSNGYYDYHLYKDGKRKRFSAHRLVAIAFIPNPENKPEIDHIDTIRDNNYYKNLRWATPTENKNNPLTRKTMSEVRIGKLCGKNNPNYGNKGDKNANSKAVLQYTKSGKFLKRHENAVMAAEAIGCHHTNISRCCNNIPKYKSAGGYRWKFEITD